VRLGVAALVLGCGRIDFQAPDAATPDAFVNVIRSTASEAPCSSHLLLDTGGHNSHDVIRWVFDGESDWIIGANHYSQDDHKIEGHRVTATDNLVLAGTAIQVAQADHVDVLNVVKAGDDMVLGYWDYALGSAWAVRIQPGLVSGAPQALGPLYGGNSPLGRMGNTGKLGFAGTVGGAISLVEVNDDATPSGRQVQVVSPADGPGPPSVTSIDDAVILAWASGATGMCKLAKVTPDLVVAGPVTFAAASCNDPHVAWLETSRRLIAVAETTSGQISAAAFDADLGLLTAPHAIVNAAHWPRIVGENDMAWLTWAEGASPQRVNYGLIDGDSNVVSMGTPTGMLDESLGHYHQIDRAGSETVITWMDSAQSRKLSALRLCR